MLVTSPCRQETYAANGGVSVFGIHESRTISSCQTAHEAKQEENVEPEDRIACHPNRLFEAVHRAPVRTTNDSAPFRSMCSRSCFTFAGQFSPCSICLSQGIRAMREKRAQQKTTMSYVMWTGYARLKSSCVESASCRTTAVRTAPYQKQAWHKFSANAACRCMSTSHFYYPWPITFVVHEAAFAPSST